MKKYIIVSLLTLLSLNLFSQSIGNQAYTNNNRNRQPIQKKSITSTENSLIISANVLLNKEADFYSVTIGVNQEGETVSECLEKINLRISNVEKGFNKIGIKNESIAIDFISETKIYDHKILGKEIMEYLVGYQVNKNIILRTKDLSAIEKVVNICSKEEIFDIIKVDYINEDVEAINAVLFDQAIAIIQAKKARYLEHSSIKLTDNYRIASENLLTYNPRNLYQKYSEAFETSTIHHQYSSYIKKDVRKSTTYYYDGVEFEMSIDKIIDEVSPNVGIQYVMEVQMIYEIAK
ncbi:MAG: hypothetical protein ACI865_003070 [Flavobacteriaceae bacterium]|jgi:uncharacterized protein YggE